jgi:hypothetical protein
MRGLAPETWIFLCTCATTTVVFAQSFGNQNPQEDPADSNGAVTSSDPRHVINSEIVETASDADFTPGIDVSSSLLSAAGIPIPCNSALECVDNNVCTCDRCIANECYNTPNAYGNADCTGSVEVGDVLCVLNGYASYALCPNGDLAPTCAGDGQIEVSDVLAVLSAYSGGNPCACPS